MPLNIVRDSDVATFTLDGDRLTLRSAVRQRDVEASDAVAREDAFKAMDDLRRAGIDPLAEAAKATPEEKAAAEASADSITPAVRVKRFELLALSLSVGGQSFGGQAIVDQYHDMDVPSAAWVDAQVASVWDAAVPSGAQREGQAADDSVSDVVSAAD